MSAGLLAFAGALLVLSVLAFGPDLRRRLASGRAPSSDRLHPRRQPAYDPGRERRAERKAQELLASVVGEDAFRMYRELGFLVVRPRTAGATGYGYLIYPHRPLVAFDEQSGELLNEYCVGFPDHSDARAGTRLPDSDDVLAKWIGLTGDERRLIADANMHFPGRQVDPAQVRRDLRRLREWEGRRIVPGVAA